MNYEELCSKLISKCEIGCDYVVKITSAYVYENLKTFGECITYETFCVSEDGNDIIWFNDWYEGQQYCDYDDPIMVIDLISAYNFKKRILAILGGD